MQLSFNRIWLLFKQQWLEQRKFYLFGGLAMIGIMGALFAYAVALNVFSPIVQFRFVMIGLVVFGLVFSSRLLKPFNNKTKKIQLLLLPVSTLEKLVCTILSTLIFPIAYLLIICPVLYGTWFIDNQILGGINNIYTLKLEDFEWIKIVGYFVMQAFVVLFSVIFIQYSFAKTIVLGFAILFSLSMFNSVLAKAMFDNPLKNGAMAPRRILYKDGNIVSIKRMKIKGNLRFYKVNNFDGIEFTANENNYPPYYSLQLAHYQSLLFKLLWLFAAPFLWVITWFKLREAQV